MHLHEVENPLLEVVKHADLHCMEEIGLSEDELRKVAQNPENVSKHVESSLTMGRREFSIGCLCVGIAERSI